MDENVQDTIIHFVRLTMRIFYEYLCIFASKIPRNRRVLWKVELRDKNHDYPIISYLTSLKYFDTSGERRKVQNSYAVTYVEDHFKRVIHKNRETASVHVCISLLLLFQYSLSTIPVLPRGSFPPDNPLLRVLKSNQRNASHIFTFFYFIKFIKIN